MQLDVLNNFCVRTSAQKRFVGEIHAMECNLHNTLQWTFLCNEMCKRNEYWCKKILRSMGFPTVKQRLQENDSVDRRSRIKMARTIFATARHPEVPVPCDWCQSARLLPADTGVCKPNRRRVGVRTVSLGGAGGLRATVRLP